MSSTDTSDNVLHQLALAELQALALRVELREVRARLVRLQDPRQGATDSSPLVLVVLTLLAWSAAFAQGALLAAILVGQVLR